MDDSARFEEIFTQFLNGYWGAFHELLEAESIRPDRLAAYLFDDVMNEHRRFAAVCPADAQAAVSALDRLWQQVSDHRRGFPDGPLTKRQIREALGEFRTIHGVLVAIGRRVPAVRDRVLALAPHGTPAGPLHVDVAS